MKNMYFTRRLSKAAFALTAILLTQSLFTSANARFATAAAADVNISSEEREISRFSADLFTFNQQVLNLSKKSRLTDSEVASARSSGNGLKQRITAAQQSFRSIIAKLKAAGQWDALDTKLNALIPEGPIRSILREEGGAKKIWEDLANNLGPLSQEIEGDVQRLSGKIQSRSFSSEGELRARAVSVAYQPAPVLGKSLRCRLFTAGLTVKLFVGNRPPTSAEGAAGREACNSPNNPTT